MRLVVASDHAGYALKEHVKGALEGAGHEVVDVGASSEESVDYPPFGAKAARLVAAGEADRGILVCGSGNGVMLAANNVPGVRAVNAHDRDEAVMARRHNGINVLTLAGRRLADAYAEEIVTAFLETDFDGGRHQRRIDELDDIAAGGDGEAPAG